MNINMNKNVLYLLITVVALAIIAVVASPQHSETITTASPVNGMVGGTTRDAQKIGSTTLKEQPATSDAPATAPNLTPAHVNDTAHATDDVPAGAEVSGDGAAPSTSDAVKPATDSKNLTLPPSEGQ